MPAHVPANICIVSGGATRGAAMWQTLEEWDADGEPALYASYVYGNYIDEVLSMRKDIDGAATTHGTEDYYFHQDDLFNVVLVTDSGGDAAERYEYGDYGAPFYFTGAGSSTPSSAINNTRLFNGREWDDESRFYYYRTRYLEPTMGRFTTRDSIGVWGDEESLGNSTQAFASSPLARFDPIGRDSLEWANAMFLFHYMMGFGSPVNLADTGLGDDYEAHPAVRIAQSRLLRDLEWEVLPAMIPMVQNLSCCGGSGGNSVETHISGSIYRGVSRSDFVNFGGVLNPWDWTFTIGGHILHMDYDCRLMVGCGFGRYVTTYYACDTSFWMTDRFTDPFDIGDILGFLGLYHIGYDPYPAFDIYYAFPGPRVTRSQSYYY